MEQNTISALYQQSPDKRETYITARIQGQIEYYEFKSSRNKKLYLYLSALAIVANALVPVISVFLDTNGDNWVKLSIALLSSFALVSTSIMGLLNAKELWNKYRSSANYLTALLHQYRARTGTFDGLGEEEAFRLLARLAEERLDDENKIWGDMQRSAKQSAPGK